MTEILPGDRGHLLTEQSLDVSHDLDTQDVQTLLQTINEQDQLVPDVLRAAIPVIAQLVSDLTHRIKQGGRLIYIGAGTSGRLGVLDASECPPTFCCDPGQVLGLIAGGDQSLRRSSEGAEDDPRGALEALKTISLTDKDMLVGIAAGGTTPYVWGALGYAQSCDAATAMICCVPMAPPFRVAIDYMISLPVGPEVLTGSTRLKAGTATKLALNMISTSVMVQLGKTWGNLMVDIKATNAKLRDRAARILAKQCSLARKQAFELLDQAQGQVKVALVMHKLGLSPEKAMQQLRDVDGHLRLFLGNPVR